MKKALILGVLGQDGSFMAELLSSKGYEVHGIVKENTLIERIEWIESLVININIHRVNILDKSQLSTIIKIIKPNEIYNFAGMSNVFNAWEDLDSVFDINARLPQNIMDIILYFDRSIKYFQASSSLIFGRDTSGKQNELTPTNPIYPYGITKLYADNMVKEYRKTFGLYFCSGILFNHESERRGDNFFSKKITREVCEIKKGKKEKIKVGNLSALRDYGYAPDYTQAIYLMMNNSEPKDYVIGTGKTISMYDFLKKCCVYMGINHEECFEFDTSLYRENDTNVLCADITKITKDLGWKPKHSIDDIIKIMIDKEFNK